MSIFADLYWGEVRPLEVFNNNNEAYYTALDKHADILGQIQEEYAISHKTISRLETAQSAIHNVLVEQAFGEGVSFGIRLMMEVFASQRPHLEHNLPKIHFSNT